MKGSNIDCLLSDNEFPYKKEEDKIIQEQEEYIEKLVEKVYQFNKPKCQGNEVLLELRLGNHLPNLVRSFIGKETVWQLLKKNSGARKIIQ